MYAVEPLKFCEHLKEVAPLPECGLNVEDECSECQAKGENWVCLVCYKVNSRMLTCLTAMSSAQCK